MISNLQPSNIHNLLARDFEDVWNSVAANPAAGGRGNFLFALDSLILLEFVGRLCWRSKRAFRAFDQELRSIEPNYFARIPGVNLHFKYFELPYKKSSQELIWALYDLIRNGQAHQYQRMFVSLADKRGWGLTLTGARYRRYVGAKSRRQSRPVRHLGYRRDREGNIWITLYPNILFSDILNAVARSQILRKRLPFNYAVPAPNRYPISSKILIGALKRAGLPKITKSP
jgi:hypothetical protein